MVVSLRPSELLSPEERIERDHSDFCDRIGDAAIALQDAAYKLGRERGKKEADESLMRLIMSARDRLSVIRIEHGIESEDLIIKIDSVRAKHEGAAS